MERIQPEINLSPGYDAQCSYCPNYGYTSRMDEYGNVTRYCVDCIKKERIQEEMLDIIFGKAADTYAEHCDHNHKPPFKKRGKNNATI